MIAAAEKIEPEMEVLPMKANFLVIGAAKAGTSWLHVCMDEHPEVFVPMVKEVRYFSFNYEKAESWYSDFFNDAAGEVAVGELSPSYLITKGAAERIHSYNPDIKIICILRDPVSRAYSHYCMLLRNGVVTEDVDKEIFRDTRMLQEGLYADHLKPFIQTFRKTQIKLVLHDDLESNPVEFLENIYRFLGVDASHRPSILHKKFHERKPRPRFPRLFRARVAAQRWLMHRNHHLYAAVDFIRRRGYQKVVYGLTHGPNYPKLSPKRREELAEYYSADVNELSLIVGRDLSFWLQPTRGID